MSRRPAMIGRRAAMLVALAVALAAAAVGTVNAKQSGGGVEGDVVELPPLCRELGILPPRKDPDCEKAARSPQPPPSDVPPLCLELGVVPPLDDPLCENLAAASEPPAPPAPPKPSPEPPDNGAPGLPGVLPGEPPADGERPKPSEFDVGVGQGERGNGKGKGKKGDKGPGEERGSRGGGGQPVERPARRPDGTPTKHNPTATVAPYGPAPLGVPNPVIESFSIPPFLLPIYQACGTQYGIPWQVLASINRIETAFGTNLNVSTAGAVGWMQFLPSTWKAYGVDANGDGRKDPYNPLDAICGAANYLNASGGETDLRGAIFAYNHADWYVDEVLLYADQYGKLPSGLVDGLVGLTENAHFPIAARARYAEARHPRPGIDLFAKRGSDVVAVNDGVIERIGESRRLGRHIVFADNYGNRFTYAELGTLEVEAAQGKRSRERGDAPAAWLDALLRDAVPGYKRVAAYLTGMLGGGDERPSGRRLREGSRVRAGTVLAEVGKADDAASHIQFAIEPAGRGSRKIDPKPILDGWKLIETTAIYRATGESPFDDRADVGEILLMSKAQLRERALRDPRLEVYACGRQDIRAGRIDRRVLATLSYLTARGFELTVTSLKCGHSYYTASGNVSHHSSGNAVDIAAINGRPILGHQGRGSLAESVVRELLGLQGAMQPAQIISLMDFGGPTLAMADHADHIHVGFNPVHAPGSKGGAAVGGLLEPSQWDLLLERVGELDQPTVPAKPSKFSLPAKRKARRASRAHAGE